MDRPDRVPADLLSRQIRLADQALGSRNGGGVIIINTRRRYSSRGLLPGVRAEPESC